MKSEALICACKIESIHMQPEVAGPVPGELPQFELLQFQFLLQVTLDARADGAQIRRLPVEPGGKSGEKKKQ